VLINSPSPQIWPEVDLHRAFRADILLDFSLRRVFRLGLSAFINRLTASDFCNAVRIASVAVKEDDPFASCLCMINSWLCLLAIIGHGENNGQQSGLSGAR
jgi:hypothetical protein